MKKTLSLIALLVVVGVAAAAGYFFYLAPQSQQVIRTTEAALPSTPGDADYTVALKLTDMSSLKSIITGTSSLISEFQPVFGGETLWNAYAGIVPSLNDLGSLLDTITEMSILATRQQSSSVCYISLLADGAAFSRVMAGLSSAFYTVEKWETGIADSEGWHIKGTNGFSIRVMKRGGDEKSQILAAGTEQAVSAMISAADGKSPQFSLERATSGANFLHVKLKNGFTYGMLNEFLTGFSDNGALNPGEGIFKGNSDRVIFTVYEYSDTQNGNVVTMESYSDAVEKNPGLAARHPKSAAAPRLMGDGELAYFLAFDTGFILSSVFPGVEDPAQEAFKLLGAVPLFSNDLKAIISSARISIACVTKDKKLNTAYALIETEAPESLNKLYSMISFLGLPRTELQGWDSAFSTSIPNFGLGAQNVVLAHGKGVLLSGIGSAEDFAKSPETPEEYKEFLSQDDIVNGVVSAKLYDALLDMAQNMPSSASNADSSPNEASIAMITAIRDSFDFAGGKVSASGNGYGKYVSSKDGNLIKALFGAFSHAVQHVAGTAASESE